MRVTREAERSASHAREEERKNICALIFRSTPLACESHLSPSHVKRKKLRLFCQLKGERTSKLDVILWKCPNYLGVNVVKCEEISFKSILNHNSMSVRWLGDDK